MNGTAHGVEREAGFALLVLLAIVAAGSMTILLAVRAFVPPLAGQAARVDASIAEIERAAREAFERNGSFPADLTSLAAVAGLEAGGAWRIDPLGFAQDYDYRIRSGDLQISSRGADHRLGTADDVVCTIDGEMPLRLRQRARLRLLRALLTVSPYRAAASMSSADRTAMRAAMREQAICRRQWYGTPVAGRAALTARMTTASTTVATLAAAHGCPSLPVAIVGAGGLMQQIGASDSSAVDGLGRPLAGDAVLGVIARGSDGTGGTDDDM